MERQAPWLILLIALNIPLMLAVLVNGRRSHTMRKLELGLGLLTCAAMILSTTASDQTCKAILLLVASAMMIYCVVQTIRKARATDAVSVH